jgi:predicted transposase YbfD/YdcC
VVKAVASVIDQAGFHAAGGNTGALLVRPIDATELLAWRAHMERFHYLGDAALVGESLRYVAELDGGPVALLSWGAAALRNGPRDRHVGWDDEARMANLHLVANNARFLILPWARQANLASRVLAANLRRLSRDWQAVYGHPLVLAETFVDTSRFHGTCYRAANWVCVGETKGWSKSGQKYRFNGQPKSVWLYPLVRDFITQLCGATRKCARREDFMVMDVERLPLYGQGGLLEILEGFPDCRKRRGIRHRIESVLASALCAVLAGARSFVAIAEWADEQSADTLKHLGSKRGKPPSERTYRRVLHSIDVEELDRRTGAWMAEQQRLRAGAGLALDGKTVRGSSDGEQAALHLLSAIVHGSGTVAAQTAVDSKTNEITNVSPLLENLDIAGTVVTADALLCQREIARHIVEDKQADYVFTVKDNQPTLRQDISEQFVSERHDAERLQRARNPRSRANAFPPSAPHSGQGSRSHRDA